MIRRNRQLQWCERESAAVRARAQDGGQRRERQLFKAQREGNGERDIASKVSNDNRCASTNRRQKGEEKTKTTTTLIRECANNNKSNESCKTTTVSTDERAHPHTQAHAHRG